MATSTFPASNMTSQSCSSSAAATVRYATEEDVPLILSLIHQLAEYEKATSSVLATHSSLLATLSFPSNPNSGYARTLLIFPPSQASLPRPPTCAGFALYYPSYSTWRAAPGIYLEDLFVLPQHRGCGYGKRLLGELARETLRMGGHRLEWSVLKWNEPSIRFYEGKTIGAKRLVEWMGMRVETEGGGLERLAGEGRGVDVFEESGGRRGESGTEG